MLRALRQPRYAALSVLMVLVAAICVAAGTWQIARLAGKVRANDELRHNAHATPAPVSEVLPLVGSPRPADHSVQFRIVTATGSYESAGTQLVRQRTVNSDTGYLVLSRLRTPGGTLLVVRGFLSGTSSEAPPTPPAPPAGTVTVRARVEPGETRADDAARLPSHELESINPVEQAARSSVPVFYGYGELLGGQPGTAGLTAIPDPDLSNPAGGAIEPQHVAYIIQWYLFALLALAAPIAMVRAETRIKPTHDIDHTPAAPADTTNGAAAAMPTAEQRRAAKLADRYGRPVH